MVSPVQPDGATSVSHRFFVGSYNVNGQAPQESLLPWLSHDVEPPDVYCLGEDSFLPIENQGPNRPSLEPSFQALDLSKEGAVFNDSPREEEWFEAVTKSLHPGAKYAKGRIFADKKVEVVQDYLGSLPPCGFLERLTAPRVLQDIKGAAVAIRFRFHSTTICVVNAHLTAHPPGSEQYSQDIHDICACLQFFQQDPSLPTVSLSQHEWVQGLLAIGLTACVLRPQEAEKVELPPAAVIFLSEFLPDSIVLWLGDLNSRLEQQDMEQVKKLVDTQDFRALYWHDQLKSQMEEKKVFEDFTEGDVIFQPTYKYKISSDEWDTRCGAEEGEQYGAFAWCDRILFKGESISQLDYRSHLSLRNSNHKPVSAVFDIVVKMVDEQLYRKVFEETFFFKDVKFLQLQVDFFIIHNGPTPCQFEFICKPHESSYCKPWLTPKPSKGFLLADAEVTVELEVFVNKSTASHLNSGEDQLEDVLVLHLDQGKDYFLSVTGNYLPSCFGTPIHALIHMRQPIQDILPETIKKLTLMPLWSGDDFFWDEKPLDLPKELWMMLDHLYLGSSCSVAEVLLLFLESLPEPVICFQLYDRSMESAGSYGLSSQVVSMLPECHKNVFNCLMAFLRELLRHSEKNHLNWHILASVFGPVLLRPPPGHPAPNTAEKQKAQQFLQHFLFQEGSSP
ncbi:Type II inositol-1,4,5-trisphosphate 5-phosphatase, partial [Ophiophagus hannah]